MSVHRDDNFDLSRDPMAICWRPRTLNGLLEDDDAALVVDKNCRSFSYRCLKRIGRDELFRGVMDAEVKVVTDRATTARRSVEATAAFPPWRERMRAVDLRVHVAMILS